MRLVVGTRPEATKLKPVARALQTHGIAPTLIFTGQQCLNPAEFGLSDYRQVDLGCPGQKAPHAHVRNVTLALRPMLRDRPDLIVVQGDSSSALGGALACFMAAVPVAQVEAGLRTHSPLQPRDGYRTAIDADADLLFAPTDLAAATLRAENVAGEIHIAVADAARIASIMVHWLDEKAFSDDLR